MNGIIYFDYFNNYYLNYDYLSSIELFRYKYEIFLCTSSIIIIGIFSVIFNKMNKLNKKLEKELMDLHLTVNVHDDNLTINNNKIIKNYDTLNEENKKLHEEILNLKETINVHESALMQNNNKNIDIDDEIKDIRELVIINESNIIEFNGILQNHEINLINNNYIIDNQLIFIGYERDNKSLFVNKNIDKLTWICGRNISIADTLILSQLRFLNKIKDRLLLSEIAYANLTIYFDDECTIKNLNETFYPSNNNHLEEKIIKMKYLRFQDLQHCGNKLQRIEHNIKAIKELKEHCSKYDINLILDFENIEEHQKQYFIK